jgi:hypothetical protein
VNISFLPGQRRVGKSLETNTQFQLAQYCTGDHPKGFYLRLKERSSIEALLLTTILLRQLLYPCAGETKLLCKPKARMSK